MSPTSTGNYRMTKLGKYFWKEEMRKEITPSFQASARPQIIQILKLLPKTNCRECGEVTCMLFAVRVAEGAKDVNACLPLDPENRRELEHYMSHFNIIS
jgi:ArsR family metal-binding transcriptional regulator